jgi:hypothetical protein
LSESLLAARTNLGFERRADKIAITPDHATTAHRTEIIERDTKFERHDVQTVQSKADAPIGDIADTTAVDALLAGEVRQYIAIDRCMADHASLDVASRLEYFLKRRHAARLSHGGKQTAGLA